MNSLAQLNYEHRLTSCESWQHGVPTAIHVRDSKNTRGPRLTLSPAAWAGFVELAKSA